MELEINLLLQKLIEEILIEKPLVIQYELIEEIGIFENRKSIRQIKSNLCGFHALFNGFSLFTQTYNRLSSYSFWKFYYNTRNFLMQFYPTKSEVKDLENYGELQRFHMDFLLQNEQYLNLIVNLNHKQMKFETLLYGFNIIQNSYEEILKLDRLFEEFRNSEQDQSIILFCGITVHWMTLVLTKVDNKFKIVVMDSQNPNLKALLENNIQQLVSDYERETKLIYNRDLEPWDMHLYTSFLIDLRNILLYVEDFIVNKKLVKDRVVENSIQDMLESFEQICGEQQQQFKKILYWLQHEFRPEVITNHILDNAKIYQYSINKSKFSKKLRDWCNQVEQVMKENKNQILDEEQNIIIMKTFLLIDQFRKEVKL